MASVMRCGWFAALVFAGMFGCRTATISLDDEADASSDASSDETGTTEDDSRSAAELFGLQVGARWIYVNEFGQLRWKEITGCDDILVADPITGEERLVRAYVRVNRNAGKVTSVHYLIEDDEGVKRVRRDDVVGGANSPYIETYSHQPPLPRIYNDTQSHELQYSTVVFDWAETRGSYTTQVVHEVLGEEMVSTIAGQFQARVVSRHWQVLDYDVEPGLGESRFALGIGEVAESGPCEGGMCVVEQLVEYQPGYASCDGREPLFLVACDAPLQSCDDAWGTGVPGCTDPRVDADNCGACGVACASGVCADGACVEPGCAEPCEGDGVCCPSPGYAWAPGCTNPRFDPMNCGGCGVICPSGLMCDRGQCTCPPGTADCGDGICRDVTIDLGNCGACGNACEAPLQCLYGQCLGCEAFGLIECGGICVDPNSDDANCGACGNACGVGDGTAYCAAGECLTCAEAGMLDCNGACKDPNWSDAHCGACGQACAPDEACVLGQCLGGDGTCAAACTDNNEICCEGACVDPRWSDEHCGGCGVATCEGLYTCANGACRPNCPSD